MKFTLERVRKFQISSGTIEAGVLQKGNVSKFPLLDIPAVFGEFKARTDCPEKYKLVLPATLDSVLEDPKNEHYISQMSSQGITQVVVGIAAYSLSNSSGFGAEVSFSNGTGPINMPVPLKYRDNSANKLLLASDMNKVHFIRNPEFSEVQVSETTLIRAELLDNGVYSYDPKTGLLAKKDLELSETTPTQWRYWSRFYKMAPNFSNNSDGQNWYVGPVMRFITIPGRLSISADKPKDPEFSIIVEIH